MSPTSSEQAGRLAGNALLERGHLLQAILDNSKALVCVKDIHGRYLLINHCYEALFRLNQEEIAGKTDYDVFPVQTADRLRENDIQVLIAETAQEFEEVIPHGDQLHTYLSLKFPITGPSGAPYAICAVSTDITSRKRAEKASHQRERELGLARAIQQRRLPRAPPALDGFDIGGASLPAQETGGDYLDFIAMPDDSLGLAIGDASGHGIAAALLMAETRAYLRALAYMETDVGRILTLVNRHVAEDVDNDDFVTLTLARLNPRARSLVYGSAGHWPGYLLDGQGEVKRVLHSTGIPIGIDPASAVPCAETVELATGDLLLLLTDGIPEAFPTEGAPFGIDRALDCVRAHRHAPSSAIVSALLDEVQTFSPGGQIDDLTALVLKVSP